MSGLVYMTSADRRLVAAAAAMTGLLSQTSLVTREELAIEAIKFADTLLTILNKQEKEKSRA